MPDPFAPLPFGFPSGPIETYRQLSAALVVMTPEQLDSNITVENGPEGECYFAELRICSDGHLTLDDGHPVLYF